MEVPTFYICPFSNLKDYRSDFSTGARLWERHRSNESKDEKQSNLCKQWLQNYQRRCYFTWISITFFYRSTRMIWYGIRWFFGAKSLTLFKTILSEQKLIDQFKQLKVVQIGLACSKFFFSFLLNSLQAHISNGCLKKYWQNILNSFTLFQSFFSQVCLKYFQLSHDMVTIFWNFKGRMKIKQKKF